MLPSSLYAIFWKIESFDKNCQKSQFHYLEKGALELCRAAPIKPRQIEHSVFFSTGPQWTNLTLQTGLRSNWFWFGIIALFWWLISETLRIFSYERLLCQTMADFLSSLMVKSKLIVFKSSSGVPKPATFTKGSSSYWPSFEYFWKPVLTRHIFAKIHDFSKCCVNV